jgi:hypothetical protein
MLKNIKKNRPAAGQTAAKKNKAEESFQNDRVETA